MLNRSCLAELWRNEGPVERHSEVHDDQPPATVHSNQRGQV